MQSDRLKRREFVTLLGGAATWPLGARAQQPAVPVIGYLGSGTPGSWAGLLAAFHEGLSQVGYVEGRNVAVEYRWSQGQSDRLPELAAELVRRQVAVIVAAGGIAPAQAAKAATATIPIVFLSGDDPIEYGLVTSLSRPGGNVTGISWLASALEAKRLGLMHDVVPNVGDIGVLVNPNFPGARTQVKDAEQTARERGIRIQILNASSERDFDTIFATLVQQRVGALVVNSNPLFMIGREQLVALAARHAIPAVYYAREFCTVGGLMSYGTSLNDSSRQSGIYAGRILRGEKSANLPVLQPTKFEFVVNMKTAKSLGLNFPPGVLAIADEVIE